MHTEIAIAAVCLIAIAAILLWIKTGSSPLLWTARVLLSAEAAREQAWSSLGVAARDYRRNYHGTRAVLMQSEVER